MAVLVLFINQAFAPAVFLVNTVVTHLSQGDPLQNTALRLAES